MRTSNYIEENAIWAFFNSYYEVNTNRWLRISRLRVEISLTLIFQNHFLVEEQRWTMIISVFMKAISKHSKSFPDNDYFRMLITEQYVLSLNKKTWKIKSSFIC